MNELKVFQNSEFGEIGVLTIDGKEYFPATQCARILGYSDPFKAIKQHCKEDGWVKRPVIDNLGRKQEMKFINEGNLYRLIVRSKLPAAEKFERWVFDEVLPEIRRNGTYGSDINIQEIIAKTATAVVSEVVRQLVPVLSYDVPKVHNRRRGPVGIIGKLEPTLKKEVEEMIMSERFSYLDVVNYLNELGVEVSIGAVWRYAQRMKEFAI